MNDQNEAPAVESATSFEFDGQTYTAAFGYRAMRSVEAHYGKPFMRALRDVLPGISEAAATGGDEVGQDTKIADIGKLFEFALLKHQPDMDEARTDAIIDGIGIMRAMAILAAAVYASVKTGLPTPPAPSQNRRARRAEAAAK